MKQHPLGTTVPKTSTAKLQGADLASLRKRWSDAKKILKDSKEGNTEIVTPTHRTAATARPSNIWDTYLKNLKCL